jgi:YidC/Oxa1 family membrane protein insertase
MTIWFGFVDLLRALIFATAHVAGGSVGSAIVVVSLAARVALLPLTIRMARRARAHQEKLRRVAPELERLKTRFANDRARLAEETLAVYRKHDIELVPRGAWSSLLLQAPLSVGLYQAIAGSARRAGGFLWMRDLAAPDIAVAVIASVTAGLAASAAGEPGAPSRMAALVAAGLTFYMAWRLTAGVGVYWVVSNAVGLGQALYLRRDRMEAPKA